MTFEQPASLNKYVAPALPFTWSFRWKLYRVLLPVAIFSVAGFFPWVLFQEWVTDQWKIGRLAILLVLPILLLVAMEIQMRLQWLFLQKCKRALRLEENYFQITPPNKKQPANEYAFASQ